MAASDIVILIVIVATIGAALAWLVGRLADRDKAKREAAQPPAKPAPWGDLSTNPPPLAAPAAPGGGACPTCRTPYRADLAFCWACGRDKVPAQA